MAKNQLSLRHLRARPAPPKRTITTNKHRFEGFTQRIARLKINPIRRLGGPTQEDGETRTTFSYFKSALDRWIDSNLSDQFTKFVKDVEFLSESLPQIIHHENEIAGLLLDAIENGTSVSLEPLLDLISQLAHDLGPRFENHFSRAVSVIARVASTNPDVAVIEWSFNCLAWLFKYLSKLLVPDLRPLFDMMAPLLGKSRQKEFVSRFAAEAFGYLIRRASVVYSKDKKPLSTIIQHVMDDVKLSDSSAKENYARATSIMFSEAMKGGIGSLSSGGAAVFLELLKYSTELGSEDPALGELASSMTQAVLQLVQSSVSAPEFLPVTLCLVEQVELFNISTSPAKIAEAMKMLVSVVSFKSGTTMEHWNRLLDSLASTLLLLSTSESHRAAAPLVLACFAVAHHYAPLDCAIGHLALFDVISVGPLAVYLPGFCELYAELNGERFRKFLLALLQRFIASSWRDHHDGLCLLLSGLVSDGVLVKGAVRIPTSWQKKIKEDLEIALHSKNEDKSIFRASFLLKLIHYTDFDDSAEREIVSLILGNLQPLQVAAQRELGPDDLFLFSDALSFISSHDIPVPAAQRIWSAICNVSRALARHQAFWRAALDFVEYNVTALETSGAVANELYESILTCLQSPSHENRSLALKLIMLLKSKDSKAVEVVRIAQSIEENPPSLDTMRFMSMQVRKLSQLYSPEELDEFLLAAIPSYCFGLLRVRFASLWSDACSALGEVVATEHGEAIVLPLTLEWLQTEIGGTSESTAQEPAKKYEHFVRNGSAPNLDTAIERTLVSPDTSDSQFQKNFWKNHIEAAPRTSLDRPQALRLLKSAPQFAEKKARHIVPILLDQVLRSEKSELSEQRWNRKDMKDMLALFALFTNPKSLHRSDEVYSALLSLLAHGDAEIQKSSLLAILTWKNESIVRYKEQLLNLFDDAQFRDQISRFLAGGDEEDCLQANHKPHVMPIILRLLYGRAIRQSKGDHQATRRAVFDLISGLADGESREFLDIALGPLRTLNLAKHSEVDEAKLGEELLDQRRQHGLMNMLKDMLDFLGAKTGPFAARLVDPVVYCLIRSSAEYTSSGGDGNTTSSLAKSVRSSAMSCLTILFRIQFEFSWAPYLPLIFKYLISPRMENLEVETAQGVSGLLKLLATWASSDQHARFLFTRDSTLLQKLADCIGHPGTKIEVKGFVLREILLPLLRRENAESYELIRGSIYATTGHLLAQLEACLNTETGIELVDDAVSVIVDLTSSIELSYPVLLKLAVKLIRQPARKVRLVCKMKLLMIVHKAIPTTDLEGGLFEEVFEVVCSTYSRDSSSAGRALLSNITLELANREPGLTEISQLVDDMNSFSSSKLDAPDFERRLAAYQNISERCAGYSCPQWRLVLANCFFYVRDTEELSIRASAAHCIREFVDATSTKTGNELTDHLRLLQDTVLEGVYAGIRDQPEVVRVEYLSIVNQMVQRLPEWPPIKDLNNLLWDDEEASFFLNLLHIQQHRRIRAMHRLVEEANRGTLSKGSISNFLIPQLERFIFSNGGDAVVGALSAEAMSAIGHLVDWLDFSQFRSLFRRYISYIRKKPEIQETIIKLLDNVSSAFVRCCKLSETPTGSRTVLSTALPSAANLKAFIVKELVPQLLQFVQEKDESFVSRRLLAAIVYTKVILPLPPDEFSLRFPPLLMDTCNILRSKDQSSRDQTRHTLSTICSIVGPRGFGFVLSELRRALQNGFYLHVLGYTAHAIIETNMKGLKTGELDHCVDTVARIVMDDIFSTTGQEKDVSEYVKNNWSRREAKSKMSFDTMQLMASITSLGCLVNLVEPLESLLLQRPDHKMRRNIDELLRRIELGVLQNPSLVDRDILVFCYQIIKSAQKAALENPGKGSSQSKLSTLTRFALEVVRSVLVKHKELRTSSNVEGFLPVIREAMLQGQDEVKLSAIRLFTAIMVVPSGQITSDASTYMKIGAKIVEQSQSSTDELSQASLKLISTILRSKADVSIPEETIAGLLKKIKPDLQMVGRQGTAFNLLRSIISRKIVVPEVYELIDAEVAAIFVRDHDRATRDLARGVYIQFIMEYPQGKKRFSKQLSFLVRNLEYEYSEGRQSTMEALNLLINKLHGEELIQEAVKESFWPVVSIMVNDDSSDCRAMASGLVKTIISRANDDWIKGFLSLLRQLFAESSRNVQKRTALQCWQNYMEVTGQEAQDLDVVLRSVGDILASDAGDIESSWQIRYYALHTIQAIRKVFPGRCFDSDSQALWGKIIQQLSFPQSWVKLEATKLIGHLISMVLNENFIPERNEDRVALTAQSMCDIMHHLLNNLRDGVTEELASLTVQHLAVLGKNFAESGLVWHSKSHEQADTEDSDSNDTMDDDKEPRKQVTALRYLVLELAATLKRNTEPKLSSLVPRSAALQLITALCGSLSPTELEPCLEAIMHPLVHLTDTSVVVPATADDQFKEAYAELVTNATTLMDLLQKKLGTVGFVKMLQAVKSKIAEQRDERRRKRRIEAVTQPEVVERRKIRKREKVKVKKKERVSAFRSKRRGW